MKTTLLGVSLAMVLSAGVASAQPYFTVRPALPPTGYSYGMGSYQLQTVQEWVAGGEQQQWVNGVCPEGYPYGYDNNGAGCTPGGYQMVATPGYYTTVERWVWVPLPRVRVVAPPVRVVVNPFPGPRYGVGYGYGYGRGYGNGRGNGYGYNGNRGNSGRGWNGGPHGAQPVGNGNRGGGRGRR